MKICVYEVGPHEMPELQRQAELHGVELFLHPEVPGMDSAGLAEGCEGVSILGQGKITAALLDAWKAMGVRYLSTRTVGFNHIDVAHAKSIGIKVCNASYPPSGVAEFTIMLMLMCLRDYKQSLWRGQVNDYSLHGMMGRELNTMTVGIMGTGRIGREVMRLLQPFGCRILAYDIQENEDAKKMAEYVDLDTLYAECDIISLHMPLFESTYHMIDREAIAKMKDGVILINCARGGLADAEALIGGIESEKIGALGLDVFEDEEGITHVDHRIDILINRNMAYLRQFKNVVMTPHMAFYTETAIRYMVKCGIEGIVEMARTGTCATVLE